MIITPFSGRQLAAVVSVFCICAATSTSVSADQQPAGAAANRNDQFGIQALAAAVINWPVARDSFEAVGADTRLPELGGGVQVMGLWRGLFAQVSASRWTADGERSFVDSSGERFPLGIPLAIRATYVDVTAGWRVGLPTRRGVSRLVPYVGAGAGVVKYTEESPFAQADENLDVRAASYHVLGGVEVRLFSWLSVAGEVRYRYVPGILGDDGVSGELEQKGLNSVRTGAELRIGFGGRPRPPAGRRAGGTEPTPDKPTQTADPYRTLPRRDEAVPSGVIVARAPVYLYPDPRRTPLRVLEPGTAVRILEETDTWIRVQFQDPQFGPRVGYVERQHVQMRKQP